MVQQMENQKISPIAQTVQMLKSKYWALPHRDRLALNLLSIFFSILFFVYGVFLPAHNYAKDADVSYAKNNEEYQWFKSKEPEVRALKNVARTVRTDDKSMLSLASSTAKQRNLTFKRTEPEGDNGLRVWLEDVSFNDLIMWLDTLNSRNGVVPKQISIDRQETPGKASAKIVLERS